MDRLNVPCRIREWKHGNLGGLAQKLQSCKRESGFFDSFFFSANRSRSVELSPSRRIDVLIYLADRSAVRCRRGARHRGGWEVGMSDHGWTRGERRLSRLLCSQNLACRIAEGKRRNRMGRSNAEWLSPIPFIFVSLTTDRSRRIGNQTITPPRIESRR